MSEAVTRHRGGGYDDNDDPIAPDDEVLQATAVAPGASDEYQDRARNGESIAYSVYFVPEVDLNGSDELTVRGERFAVTVEHWRSPRSGRSGTVALCTSGKG